MTHDKFVLFTSNIISVSPRQCRWHKSLNTIMDAKQHESAWNGMTTPSTMNYFAVVLIIAAPPWAKTHDPK